MLPAILGTLFAVYVLATLWQGRRAVASTDPQTRLRESMRLLWLVSAGVPLLIALIFVAL